MVLRQLFATWSRYFSIVGCKEGRGGMTMVVPFGMVIVAPYSMMAPIDHVFGAPIDRIAQRKYARAPSRNQPLLH